MSLERVIKTLEGFGFTRIEAEVYVYLAKKGPQAGKALAVALNIRKQQLYSVLRSLQRKCMVTSDDGHPAIYSAIGIEEVLDQYIRLNLKEAKAIKETKQELLASWQSIDSRYNT